MIFSLIEIITYCYWFMSLKPRHLQCDCSFTNRPPIVRSIGNEIIKIQLICSFIQNSVDTKRKFGCSSGARHTTTMDEVDEIKFSLFFVYLTGRILLLIIYLRFRYEILTSVPTEGNYLPSPQAAYKFSCEPSSSMLRLWKFV